LLQLDVVPLHHRRLSRQPDLQRDAMPHQLGPGQGGGVGDRLVHVQRVAARRHLVNEAADACDDFAGSITVPNDTAQRLPDLAQVRRPAVKPPQGGVGIGDDRADRLIDFVGNRRREVPQGDDPVGVDKRQRVLLLGFEQAHVFDRDHRLVGEGLEQRDLSVVEPPDLHPPYQDDSDRGALAQQRRRKRRAMAFLFCVDVAHRVLTGLGGEIMDMNRPTVACGPPDHRVSVCGNSLAGMAGRWDSPV
jgi:hypothetical protein